MSGEGPAPAAPGVPRVLRARPVMEDDGLRLLRALPAEGLEAVGPFVFLDHYRHAGPRGIGDEPHPHAGIEVLSYLLEGAALHRDGMGNRDRLGPGDAQLIVAGRGMLHAEVPLGGRHGLQLWASLPPERKLVEPSYAVLRAADVPVLAGPGWRLHLVAGRLNRREGPLAMSGGAVFGRLTLEPGARAVLEAAPGAELGAYVAQGRLLPDGGAAGTGELVVFGPGARPALAAAPGGTTEVAVLGGDPVRGAVLFAGPFVMDTPERLAQAKRDYGAGRMGRLPPRDDA